VLVLYHYMHPDDVVSARHFDDLAADLAAAGWSVEARPCRRGCRDERRVYSRDDAFQGVRYRRIWRPRFPQATGWGRLLNSAWMIGAWSLLALRRGEGRPDVVLVGTDPPFSASIALAWKLLAPRVAVAHWCFDLFPDAAVADGLFTEGAPAVRLAQRLMGAAYRRCDLVADLGPCMRARLERLAAPARRTTIDPWALVEPARPSEADATVRHELFGDASLALLYSGSFSTSHAHEEILELARRLRGSGIRFCFAVRGNRVRQLEQAVTSEDENVSFAPFAPESELERRLAAADVHVASLREASTGVVVPSKFFGSLAVGRPVLFAGSRDATIARLVEEHQVGWILDRRSMDDVAAAMRDLARDPVRRRALQERCHAVYAQHFSRRRGAAAWARELAALLPPTLGESP
jgi:glycosyltransferase involved in cell wall biosynthesis